MNSAPLPASASWLHQEARRGFEVTFFHRLATGHRLVGQTTANEEGTLWSVGYDIVVDAFWKTTEVAVTSLTSDGAREVFLSRDADDRWTVDGEPRPDLDGCVDVDLESSAMTNTLPVHRIEFVEGIAVPVSSAYVRAEDLRVERLEQTYTLLDASATGLRFHYESPVFDFVCELRLDTAGLVLDYPGIAIRAS